MKNPGTVALAAVIDVAGVVLFVLIGRSSHAEDLNSIGTLDTLWPFLAGLALGWALTFAWLRPLAVLWPGMPIWIITVAAGMLFRASAGQGVDFSFVVVAIVVLGIFLVGWRLIAMPIARRRVA
ncbi:DUF3054 domain-containing protein [Diaminobutyricibacter sp. McL0608]|uniref:DUF3054 domain-containing protein n=1 Tax=Leifsonia sp. McL0608 TaxID=3143537 RepID=UPI0031F3159B